MHANDKGGVNGYIGTDNRPLAKYRYGGNQFLNQIGLLVTSFVKTIDLVLLYQNTLRDHFPAA